METNIKQRLSDRIQMAYGLSKKNAESKAIQLLKKCPDQLIKNVYEWIDGVELTDIYIGKYSVPMIMAVWKNQDFIGALEVMTEFMHGDEDCAERRIWLMRR